MNAKTVLKKYIEENFSDDEAGFFSEEELQKGFDSPDECELSEDEDDDGIDKVETITNLINESEALLASLKPPQQTSLSSSSSTFFLIEPMEDLINSLLIEKDNAIDQAANHSSPPLALNDPNLISFTTSRTSRSSISIRRKNGRFSPINDNISNRRSRDSCEREKNQRKSNERKNTTSTTPKESRRKC